MFKFNFSLIHRDGQRQEVGEQLFSLRPQFSTSCASSSPTQSPPLWRPQIPHPQGSYMVTPSVDTQHTLPTVLENMVTPPPDWEPRKVKDHDLYLPTPLSLRKVPSMVLGTW